MSEPSPGLVFDAPWVLALVPLLLLVALWARRRTPAVTTVLPSRRLPLTPRVFAARSAYFSAAAAALCLLAALAGPAEVRVTGQVRRALDIVIALDVSGSMRRSDLGSDGRSRLELARREALRFAERRTADRIGLVTFARFADVLAPPTFDRRALGALLEGIRPVEAGGAEDSTAVGLALAEAGRLLSRSRAPRRVVVLVTDGEENVAGVEADASLAPDAVAAWLAERGIVVHAVAVGSDGASRAEGSGRGEEGAGFSVLRRVTERTGGLLGRANDAAALAEIWSRIDALERSPVVALETVSQPRFDIALLLAGAFAALACAFRWLTGGVAP